LNLKNTALAFAFALPALAVPAQPRQPETVPAARAKAPLPTKLRFLAPGEIDPARLLPAPPKDGSAAQQWEMAGVENLIHTRSKERHE
jgi:hypothetical protein